MPVSSESVRVLSGSTSPLSRVGTWTWAEVAPACSTSGPVGASTSSGPAEPPVDTANVIGLVGALDAYTTNVAGEPLVVMSSSAKRVSTGTAAGATVSLTTGPVVAASRRAWTGPGRASAARTAPTGPVRVDAFVAGAGGGMGGGTDGPMTTAAVLCGPTLYPVPWPSDTVTVCGFWGVTPG